MLTRWVSAAVTATILAGGETDLPADTPSCRLDTAGEFSFVGALAISSGGHLAARRHGLSPLDI
ncbi:MAG: hypothetical protein MUF04_10800 [Akkermansiaceae bacterium]|nr:hypothetical protein [Akkermansiaceae bacterium]